MAGLAHPLPSLVISELLGVSPERRDDLTALSDAITPVFGTSVSATDRDRAVAAAEVMHGILGEEMDRRRTEYPDAFDPDRSGPPVLSFALGPHFCLGASLARAEVEAMFIALVRRFPKITAFDRPRRWHQRGPFRGLDELTLRVT